MKRFKQFAIGLLIAIVGGIATVGAQTTGIPGDVTRYLGSHPVFPYGIYPAQVGQSAAGQFANRVQLAAGVVTITFPAVNIVSNGQPQTTAYNSIPVGVATEEASTGHYLKITAISTSSVTFTSDVTSSNTDYADYHCFGNPN